MSHILVINSSVAGDNSASRKVAKAVVDRIQAQHPGSEVKSYDLATAPFPHVDPTYVAQLYAQKSPEQDKVLQRSNAAVQDLMWADHIVIGIPFYNFSIPSTLKSWVDHICRPGLTFKYTEKGPEGLVTGKKVSLVISSGGVYSSGPMQVYDFAEPYLKGVLGFLGMKDITTYRAEGTSIPGQRESAVEKAIASIR